MDFDCIVEDGDRVSVYPVFERVNIEGLSRVREKPLRNLQFIVDKDPGGFVPSLRNLGLDVCFRDDLTREQILEIAKEEHRIFLTQERALCKSEECDRMIVLCPGSLSELVKQVMQTLDLGCDRGREEEIQ
jgi:hypothetical protein